MNDKMRQKLHRAQSGQAIVLIALVVVALIGAAGLAIDGGSMYLNQRQIQNAVDAAVLAGTQALCAGVTGTDLNTAMLIAADRNGFNNDGTTNTVSVSHPPVTGTKAGDADYVEVVIWKDVPTYLIGVVYTGPTEVTTRGIGHCIPAIDAFAEFSFAALASSGNKAFDFSGNAGVSFCGGGVHSNAGAETSNNSIPTADGNCDQPTMTSAGAWAGSEHMGAFEFSQSTGNVVENPFAVLDPPPNPGGCTTNGTLGAGGSPYTITGPTCFTDIKCFNNETVAINGATGRNDNILYINGGVDIKCNFSAENVFIYSVGSFSMNSGANSFLSPMLTGDWGAFMMWVDGGNMTLNGSAGSIWRGTMYVPNGVATVNGGSDSVFTGQVISNQIDLSGGNNSKIIYDSAYIFTRPPSVAIAQ